jgi:hypothetical protein
MTPKGPGLAKARGESLIVERLHVRVQDARWRELFARADAVSEGAARRDRAGTTWYGTTSLILAIPGATESERAYYAAVAERDVHVRLRALRTARREASIRAPGILGRSHCEIHVAPDPRGVRIDVDIQAPLIEGSKSSSGSEA